MEPQKDNKVEISSNMPSSIPVTKDHISFFQKDSYLAFVYKKTEKLTTAMYMVTSLFPDSEPMKWSLRKKVSEMLSFILGYKNSNLNQNIFIESVKERVLDIVSLLEVLSKSGLVSVMNFSILQQEFLNLINVLDEQKLTSSDSSNTLLPKTFFDVSDSFTPMPYIKNQHRPYDLSDGNIKDKTAQSGGSSIFKRSNRQSIILNLLKKKNEMSITEIAQTIKDCSEKTIQRELISLIDAGIVKKTGERRWTKYSFSQESVQ